MTTGEPLRVRGAMKPISTLRKPLASVDLRDADSREEFGIRIVDFVRGMQADEWIWGVTGTTKCGGGNSPTRVGSMQAPS